MNRNYGKVKDGTVANAHKPASLMSGTGQHVKQQKKSIAIALNEPRATGAKIPKRKSS